MVIRSLYCLLFCCLFFSCQERKEEPLSASTVTNYNRILIVLNDSLWRGDVGDSIRQYLASNIEGIRPEEPMFSLDQMSDHLFTNKERLKHNVIQFEINAGNSFIQLQKDKFTHPQNYFEVSGDSKKALIDVFKQNVDSIMKVVHDFEITEVQKEIRTTKLHGGKFLRDNFKIALDLPLDYKRVQTNTDFVWFKKEIASGNSNILIYDIPFSQVSGTSSISNVLDQLLTCKDSVVSKYIHSSEPGSFMKVDGDFVTYYQELKLDSKAAYELKGSWDMSNSFMDGPFICYPIKDEKNKRYLFVEGFTYNPSMNKRDILFELEAIIKTIQFL